jgi:hypothetical protein
MYQKQHEFFYFLKENFPEAIKGYLKHSNKNVETVVKDEEADAEEKRTEVLNKKVIAESGGTKKIKEKKPAKENTDKVVPMHGTIKKREEWAKKAGIPEEHWGKLVRGQPYEHLIQKKK